MGHSYVSEDEKIFESYGATLQVLFSTHIFDNQKQHWREISEREQKN